MPELTGLYYVGLTVRDVHASAAWYMRVLGMTKVLERLKADGVHKEALLSHLSSGMLIGLISHKANDGRPFSEFRTGLDHLELGVSDRDELEAWVAHLDAHGVAHSEIKELSSSLIVTLRDPDNIQLELYVLKP
jgi:glyoxylase I family protein